MESDSAFAFGARGIAEVRFIFVVGYSILVGGTTSVSFRSLGVPASLTGQAFGISWPGRRPPSQRRRLLPQNGIPRPGPEGS